MLHQTQETFTGSEQLLQDVSQTTKLTCQQDLSVPDPRDELMFQLTLDTTSEVDRAEGPTEGTSFILPYQDAHQDTPNTIRVVRARDIFAPVRRQIRKRSQHRLLRNNRLRHEQNQEQEESNVIRVRQAVRRTVRTARRSSHGRHGVNIRPPESSIST